MINDRTYETIRLLRGKRQSEKLVKLADAMEDFEFRRLFKEEVEIDLHVIFSRMIVSDWLSWTFLFITPIMSKTILFTFILLAVASFLKIYSEYCKNKFKKVFRGYKMSLSMVDAVIYNKYGISLPE